MIPRPRILVVYYRNTYGLPLNCCVYSASDAHLSTLAPVFFGASHMMILGPFPWLEVE